MTTTESNIAQILLKNEIEDFLFQEAELLDERYFEDWLGLLTDDIRYWMPMRRNVKSNELDREFTREGQDINWFDEGKETLQRRVQQILTGVHWAEEPLSRICHFVTNVQILNAVPSASDPTEVAVKCRFLVYRNRVAKQYKTFSKRRRWQKVNKYGRECQRLGRTLRNSDIGLPRPPIVPNYALLPEPRYRRIWRAYREIIRRLDERDECWRWQHRLWADFCRLLIQVALRGNHKFRAIAESPLQIASEQQRGRWSQVGAHSGTYLVHNKQDRPVAVLSVLWDTTTDHPKLSPWMAGLGAAAVLHLQGLENDQVGYLLVWPMHLFGEEEVDLRQIVKSGRRALDNCLSTLALADNVDIRAEGLARAYSRLWTTY